MLSAGERRGFSANTIVRDPSWRKKDKEGALRIHPNDASDLGIVDGGRVRITTEGGEAVAVAEVNDSVQPGYVSLPNGYGLSYSPAGGNSEVVGVAPNPIDLNTLARRNCWNTLAQTCARSFRSSSYLAFKVFNFGSFLGNR